MDVSNLKDAIKRDNGHVTAALQARLIPFCWLYVGVGDMSAKVGMDHLNTLQVIQYVRVENNYSQAFKVKILETDLRMALESGCLWKNTVSKLDKARSLPENENGECFSSLGGSLPLGLKIACWNCRGLGKGIPYIDSLLQESVGVLVLAEHWLWPYELYKLDEINGEFDAVGKADERLTDQAQGGRGCGGVCMLWHKSLRAAPIGGIASDRICGIEFSLDGGKKLITVIGTYLPCLEQGISSYSEHLVELERVISESKALGAVMVLGDFNAHLSESGGNVQGMELWIEMSCVMHPRVVWLLVLIILTVVVLYETIF